jgi:K+-sensing histidine kinase KdpD
MRAAGAETRHALVALLAVAAVTWMLRRWLQVSNAAILSTSYLLIILLVAATSRLWVAVLTSVAAMLSFNFFFLPPVGTFTIADPQNWIALLGFLAVSLVASHLSAVARAQTENALASRDEIARLAREREHLLEAQRVGELARQNEQLKTALLASIGHDLRTPLTAIRVAASNIQDAALSPDERREQAELVLSETERLTRLFENVLAMARIDAGAVATEARWTYPSEIVAAAREQVERTLAGRTVEAAIDGDVPVRLDPRQTAAPLAHLLENAAHYSPARCPIDIETRVAGDRLMISVRDHGAGIAAEDLPHVFERFYRGQGAAARRSGTGMGLWIVRGLLAVEKGEAWASNHVEGGAVFTIAVPVSVKAAEPAAAVS